MSIRFTRALRAASCLLVTVPLAGLAAGVAVQFDFSSPATNPFPSDRYTRVDFTQNTSKVVDLPKPDCAVQPSDCADIDVINTLDGFNTQPRISVPFTGNIDPATVTSDTVYLLNLGDTLTGRGAGDRVGINQVSFEPASRTLVFESNQLLAEHTRYLLVVTDGVRDTVGDRIDTGAFTRFARPARADAGDRDLIAYRKGVTEASRLVPAGDRDRVAALSLFTTHSASSDLQKIARQIQAASAPTVNFNIGNGGAVRAVFPTATLTGILWNRQTGAGPALSPATPVPTTALEVVPGAVGRVAFGLFRSVDYRTAAQYIPPVGTLSGTPAPQSTNDLLVEVFLPAGPQPAAGWPVEIFGHGFTDSLYGAPWTVASVMASRGIATVAISVVGHGFGPLSTLSVLPAGAAPVVVPAGGRGIDQDGNGVIDSTEGVNAAVPRTVIGSRDGLRQTVIDLMQLVRAIQGGIDVDGNGSVDLDRDRIYYAGQSFGGIYGTIFLGIEGAVKAGVPNVPGGSIAEVARLGAFRPLTAIALATRQPQLLNLPPTAGVPFPANLNFNENIPLRDLPPLVNTVPGSSAIQVVLERNEWVQQSGNPVSYAPFIRKEPLAGNAAKPVILQFAKGDQTVPNPTASAIVRAGELQSVTTYFRNDLAYAATGGAIPKNPHTFLTNIGIAAAAPFAVAAQIQIATFFATNGATIIDPDGGAPVFETPIALPLPEGLNYIP